MAREGYWTAHEMRVLDDLLWRDERWAHETPLRWQLGPKAIEFLELVVARGWRVTFTDASVVIVGAHSFEMRFAEVWDAARSQWDDSAWHWARAYATIGPFPDSPDADRSVADFGLHGCFEHVGMRRENGEAYLRIGFRLAQEHEALFLDLVNVPTSLQRLADTLQSEPRQEPAGDVIRPFAASIHAKATARDGLRDRGRLNARQSARFGESMLDDLKKCSDILIPNFRAVLVSRAAHDVASKMGVNLPDEDWHTQPRFDKGRVLLHWEHTTPLAQLRDECLQATTAGEMSRIIGERLVVAWLTKDEDRRLTQLSFKSVRPDPNLAYAQAGIELMPSTDSGLAVRDPLVGE